MSPVGRGTLKAMSDSILTPGQIDAADLTDWRTVGQALPGPVPYRRLRNRAAPGQPRRRGRRSRRTTTPTSTCATRTSTSASPATTSAVSPSGTSPWPDGSRNSPHDSVSPPGSTASELSSSSRRRRLDCREPSVGSPKLVSARIWTQSTMWVTLRACRAGPPWTTMRCSASTACRSPRSGWRFCGRCRADRTAPPTTSPRSCGTRSVRSHARRCTTPSPPSPTRASSGASNPPGRRPVTRIGSPTTTTTSSAEPAVGWSMSTVPSATPRA